MPDPTVMSEATGLALLMAALGVGALAWWAGHRQEGTHLADIGWVIGLGLGYYLGAWILEIRPRWPIREDLDRLLGLMIPAALLFELLAASPRRPGWLIWVLRTIIVVFGARVLLHGSVYVAGTVGPDSPAWTTSQELLILGAIALAELAIWIALLRLSRRGAGASLPIALAVAIGAASVTIMLSAYLAGGEAGLPLSAALLGGSLAAIALPRAARSEAPIGVAVIGLASLLVIGRFFGELRTDHAVLLAAAPLLAWIPELPRLNRLPARGRAGLRVLLVALAVSGVLADAARRFIGHSEAPGASSAAQPSLDEYMESGR